MRLLQLSDLHLLADPAALCRGRRPLLQLQQGLQAALEQLHRQGDRPDGLLLSGDLCHDESWQGYAQLRDWLATFPLPVLLLPGNHDHPWRLRAALGRRAAVAPALVCCGGVDLLLLDSHRSGTEAGWLGERQLTWVREQLAGRRRRSLVVAVHHPPLAIGDPDLDAIALADGPELLALLRPESDLRAVLFGHVHQHWQGPMPGRAEVALLGCPSTLCGFGPVQPCPLGRPGEPGGRLLVVEPDGRWRHQLLRWTVADASSVVPAPVAPS